MLERKGLHSFCVVLRSVDIFLVELLVFPRNAWQGFHLSNSFVFRFFCLCTWWKGSIHSLLSCSLPCMYHWTLFSLPKNAWLVRIFICPTLLYLFLRLHVWWKEKSHSLHVPVCQLCTIEPFFSFPRMLHWQQFDLSNSFVFVCLFVSAYCRRDAVTVPLLYAAKNVPFPSPNVVFYWQNVWVHCRELNSGGN